MVTGQELLCFEFEILQRMLYILSLAETTASSHALKSKIRERTAKLDQLENQFQILSSQRGWELRELQPLSRKMISIRFRCRNDPSIAEYLIRLYTDITIAALKYYNRWEQDDGSVRSLFQKLLDFCTVGIRQMELFL